MAAIVFFLKETLNGGYTAKAHDAEIFAEGDTLEEIAQNIKEAVGRHFEEDEKPTMISLQIVKDGEFHGSYLYRS